MFERLKTRPHSDRPRELTFSPLAWLKLQFFCHQGNTEIGGFGISSAKDLLYVEEFHTVRQEVTPMTVAFDDTAVADFYDGGVDRGLAPASFARIWLHTHPGESVEPSGTDEETFARVFGACDWSVMFILGRTGRTYARLALPAGPGAQVMLPVAVDWSAWPKLLAGDQGGLDGHLEQWRSEFSANIQARPMVIPPLAEVLGLEPLQGRQETTDDPWELEWDEWSGLLEEKEVILERER